MTEVAATEFARNFGRYREAAQRAPVAVTSHDRVTGYFVSARDFEEYQRLKAHAGRAVWAEELDAVAEEHLAQERRYPSTIGGAFYLLVLAIAAAGIAIVWTGDWRLGIRCLAGALCFAALLRLVLPARDAGMLAVRNRFFDSILLDQVLSEPERDDLSAHRDVYKALASLESVGKGEVVAWLSDALAEHLTSVSNVSRAYSLAHLTLVNELTDAVFAS